MKRIQREILGETPGGIMLGYPRNRNTLQEKSLDELLREPRENPERKLHRKTIQRNSLKNLEEVLERNPARNLRKTVKKKNPGGFPREKLLQKL